MVGPRSSGREDSAATTAPADASGAPHSTEEREDAQLESTSAETRQIPAEVLERPKRIPEIELVGPMQGVAFEDQYLICYAGTHYIQSTKLLYYVLSFADGETPTEEIARQVSAHASVDITPDQIRWLIAERLVPSGLLELPKPDDDDLDDDDLLDDIDDVPPVVTAKPQLLGVRYRIPLFPYKVTAPITGLLRHLYWPPFMVAVLIIALAINVSIYLTEDVVGSVRTLLYNPELVLVLAGLDLVAVMFHELGHASALRRAGLRYGSIGAAIYIIWPVFYTDVTHVYRLNRAQRVRVDLGGIYFDLITMIVTFTAYRITGEEFLILFIILSGIDLLEQFTPLLRFDGYYAIADIIGVPEPLSLIAPFIHDHLPLTRHRPKLLPPMPRWAKFVFAGYIVLFVAYLFYPVTLAVFFGGTILRETAQSGSVIWSQFLAAWEAGDALSRMSSTVQLGFWFLIPLGLTLFTFNLSKRVVGGVLALARLIHRWLTRQRQPDAATVDVEHAEAVAQPAGPTQPAPAVAGRGSGRRRLERLGFLAAFVVVLLAMAYQVPLERVPTLPFGTAGETTAAVNPTPSPTVEASSTSPVTTSPTATPAPSPTPEPPTITADEVLRRVVAAESALQSGEFHALIDYGNGTRVAAIVLFDLGGESGPPRLKVTTTYSSTSSVDITEHIRIGDRSWERRSGQAWTPTQTSQEVWGQIQSFLPRAAAVETLHPESNPQTGRLKWHDPVRSNDVALTVDPESGIPRDLAATTPATGATFTVIYHRWNVPVEIRPPGDV